MEPAKLVRVLRGVSRLKREQTKQPEVVTFEDDSRNLRWTEADMLQEAAEVIEALMESLGNWRGVATVAVDEAVSLRAPDMARGPR